MTWKIASLVTKHTLPTTTTKSCFDTYCNGMIFCFFVCSNKVHRERGNCGFSALRICSTGLWFRFLYFVVTQLLEARSAEHGVLKGEAFEIFLILNIIPKYPFLKLFQPISKEQFHGCYMILIHRTLRADYTKKYSHFYFLKVTGLCSLWYQVMVSGTLKKFNYQFWLFLTLFHVC